MELSSLTLPGLPQFCKRLKTSLYVIDDTGPGLKRQ